VTTPTGYLLTSYGEMIADVGRMEPYADALRRAIEPGATVVDIGAGTGIFSLLACQYGAAHVHAIEPDPSITLARAMAEANGYADRITFHRALSTEVSLPRRADVIVSDLRSVLPLFEHHISAVVDARTRLLAPGGNLLPRRDTVHAALIHDPVAYRRFYEPWQENRYRLDLTAAHSQVVQAWRKVVTSADALLVEPQQWVTLDYMTVTDPDVDGTVAWQLSRPGTAHGVLLWFDAELHDGIGFSNAPGEPELIYGQAFFPFELPIELDRGDEVAVRLRADLVEGAYVWRWDTTVTDRQASTGTKARFRQSTFEGLDLSPATLRKRREDFVPQLHPDGQVDAAILTAMGEGRSLREIAASVAERFPESFDTDRGALERVAALSVRYSV
jgi:type I protein arginine methyltransferase